MALADTAKLLASLELKDNFTPGIKRAEGSLAGFQRSIGKVGRIAEQGARTAARNIARIGIVAAAGLGAMVVAGVHSLGELARVQAQTTAVIKSTGGAARVSADQVREYAAALEETTTADDKAIQAAENLLLTFTGIGQKAFPQATKAVVDLGIAMAGGDVENANFKSSAIQIGKALNDPIKGITALTRVGVSFTAQQKKQIEQAIKQGNVYKAQKIILAELEREFGEAGKAAGTGPEAAWRRLEDAGEDLSMSLANGLLPALEKVARAISSKLKDPEVQQFFSDLGDDLGAAADAAVDFFEAVDWPAVKRGAAAVVDVGKTIVSAFMGLPDWAQKLLIGGFAVNKLTGGALTGIVSELAKGVVKGVLGITAGVVHIKAGTVVGGGALPGGGGVGGKGGAVSGGISKITGAVSIIAFAGSALAVMQALEGFNQVVDESMANVDQSLKNFLATSPTRAQLETQIATLKRVPEALDPIQRGIFELNVEGVKTKWQEGLDVLEKQLAATKADTMAGKQKDDQIIRATSAVKQQTQLTRASVLATKSAVQAGTGSTARNLDQVTSAVNRKKLSVKVTQAQRQAATVVASTSGAGVRRPVVKHYSDSQKQDYSRFLQAGAVGMANRPMSAIFGEAGREAFAILKNPRQGTIGGGVPNVVVHMSVNIDPRRITRKQTSSGVYKTYVAT